MTVPNPSPFGDTSPSFATQKPQCSAKKCYLRKLAPQATAHYNPLVLIRMNRGKRPLDAFPLVRTADLEQFRSGVGRLFQDSTVEIRSDRESVASCINYRSLQNTGLMYGSHGAAIDASFGEMQFFVQGITIRGTGEQVTKGRSASAAVGGILSLGESPRVRFSSGFEHLALKIDAEALRRKLSALIGASPSEPIRFEAEADFSHPAARSLGRFIKFLVEELSSNLTTIPAAALTEMEQAMMAWFLIGNRHNYSHLLDGQSRSPAPWQVRLERAWQMLSTPGTDGSVTEVAFACGFGNLGHFAQHFRRKFGELPSAVLNRSKGRMTADGPLFRFNALALTE